MTTTAPKHRWLFWLAVIAGVAFYATFPIKMPQLTNIALKGSGVALLAIWAGLNAHGRDGWLITGVMAFGALGDVLLEPIPGTGEFTGRTAGAAAFLVGHVIAIALYLRHRRTQPSPSQWMLALTLLIATPVIGYFVTRRADVALYACGLGAMAASAWLGRFPRYRVGLGAVLFLASDLMIFATMGPDKSAILAHLIWPLYFGGQALIAWGAVTTLLRWKADDDLHHRL